MGEAEGALRGIAGGITMAGILDYFSISGEGLIIMSVMLFIDFIFGIIDAKVRGEQIESSKWQQGLVRKASRWILPFITAGGLKRTGMGGIGELVSVIVGMIIFSELYSIIGHIYSINYKEQLPELDSFKMLLNWVIKLIKTLIGKESAIMEDSDISTKKDKDEA